MVVLGGGTVSYERGTPAGDPGRESARRAGFPLDQERGALQAR